MPSSSSGLRVAAGQVLLSVGGYYLLLACGVPLFWALAVPALGVAALTVVSTVRQGSIDRFGVLVLAEVVVTITTTVLTRDPRVIAMREIIYLLVAGVVILSTLGRGVPASHTGIAAMASFGDPRRRAAFEHAWRSIPRYRWWQRALTLTEGVLLTGFSVVRGVLLWAAPAAGLVHAIDVSNVLSTVMFVLIIIASAVMVQPLRRIITELVGPPTLRSRSDGDGPSGSATA